MALDGAALLAYSLYRTPELVKALRETGVSDEATPAIVAACEGQQWTITTKVGHRGCSRAALAPVHLPPHPLAALATHAPHMFSLNVAMAHVSSVLPAAPRVGGA